VRCPTRLGKAVRSWNPRSTTHVGVCGITTVLRRPHTKLSKARPENDDRSDLISANNRRVALVCPSSPPNSVSNEGTTAPTKDKCASPIAAIPSVTFSVLSVTRSMPANPDPALHRGRRHGPSRWGPRPAPRPQIALVAAPFAEPRASARSNASRSRRYRLTHLGHSGERFAGLERRGRLGFGTATIRARWRTRGCSASPPDGYLPSAPVAHMIAPSSG